jgi:hypothetical protein
MFQGHSRAALGQVLGAAAFENEPGLHLSEEVAFDISRDLGANRSSTDYHYSTSSINSILRRTQLVTCFGYLLEGGSHDPVATARYSYLMIFPDAKCTSLEVMHVTVSWRS